MKLLMPHPLDSCQTCGEPISFTHRNDKFGYAHIQPSDHPALPSSYAPNTSRPDITYVKVPLFLGLSKP